MDVQIRTLNSDDLSRLVAIDEAITGRRRERWYKEALHRSQSGGITMSLGAEHDGILIGAMLGSVRYGEFGQPEPSAEVDTILVHPAFRGEGIGRALMDALISNLRALRVERLRTQVDWQEQNLLAFLAHSGFEPVPRLVLEHKLDI